MFIQVVHLKWFWYSRLLTWVNLSIQKKFGWGSTNLESLDYFEQEESLHSLQFIFRLKSTFNDMKSNHLSYTCTKLCITRFDVCVVTKIMFLWMIIVSIWVIASTPRFESKSYLLQHEIWFVEDQNHILLQHEILQSWKCTVGWRGLASEGWWRNGSRNLEI